MARARRTSSPPPAPPAPTPPPVPRLPKTRHLLILLAVLLTTVLVYRPAMEGEFQFDDAMGVERGGWPLHKGEEWAGLRDKLLSWSGRGLVTATYQINYWMGGGNEMRFAELNRITPSFHVFNLGIHTLSIAAVYLLALWMARRAGRPEGWAPALAAGIFGLHPLAAESTAYISARTGAMAACFGLWGTLGLLAFGMPERPAEPLRLGRRLLGIGLLGLGTFVAVGCKETGWMFPPMAVLALVWGYRGDWRGLWKDWGVAALAAGLLFGIVFTTWIFSWDLFGQAFMRQYSDQMHLPLPEAVFAHIATQVNAWGTEQFPRLLAPFGTWHPTVDIDPPVLNTWDDAMVPRVLLLGLGLLAAAWAAVRSWRRGGSAGLALTWAALGILPVSAVALLDITTERHAYVPLAAAALGLAPALARPGSKGARAVLLGLLACLAVLTSARAAQWRTEKVLWRAAVRDAPKKPRPYYNMAKSLSREAQEAAKEDPERSQSLLAVAEQGFRMALRRSPSFHLAHAALAQIFMAQGRAQEAVAEYRVAIRAHASALSMGEAPQLHASRVAALTTSLAHCLHDLGRDEEALQDFNQSIAFHIQAIQAGLPARDLHVANAVHLIRSEARFLREIGLEAQARQTLRDGLRVFPACPPLVEDLQALQGAAGEKR